MEARLEVDLPSVRAGGSSLSWPGFRCLALRDGDDLILQAKFGALTRFFPEVAPGGHGRQRFVVHGELLITRDGTFSLRRFNFVRIPPRAASAVDVVSF
jgi:hypothetical protein